jgi:epoxide hydrolase 4
MNTSALSAGDLVGFEEIFLNTNNLRLHAIQAGPAGGPLVILLHGFPEFWYGWRRQIRPLAQSGLRL